MKAAWPDTPRATWWDLVWRRFWALPAVVAGASLALGLLLPELDRALKVSPGWAFAGGVDGARSLLGTIAGAMISVTGLVFSITMVVLQLASSQFTPRILRTFLESRIVQLTLGVFTGCFLYALTVLRVVGEGGDGRVPQIALTVSYAYVVVAVAMFLAFIHHITKSVQVTQVMAEVRLQAVATAHRLTAPAQEPATWSPPPGAVSNPIVNTGRSGYLTGLDQARLCRAAQRIGVVELDLSPGDHVVPGQVIGRCWHPANLRQEVPDSLMRAIELARERDPRADHAFGLRQLLDIADRALSPGVNDPTTAVQALDETHVVLRELAQLPDPSPYLVQDGEVVAVYLPQRYATLVEEVVAELAHYGNDAPRVTARLGVVVEDLLLTARPEHQAATREAMDTLNRR